MPVGPWPDFAACVAANQDKASPEGFCAWLEHETTGAWPSEASKIAPEMLAAFDGQVKTALSEVLKGFHFQAPKTRTVDGVEVFAVGTWIDSQGQKREWTLADLWAMSKGFQPGTIPLKVGHTSPEFNNRVAAALGVPVELLQGDASGKGQMALGHIAKLALKGDKLVAAFDGVPLPLAEMIEGGQYTAVSSEIELNGTPKLTAVALLGVEQPAVDNLAGLDMATVFGKRENALVFSFSHKQEGNVVDKLKVDSTLKDVLALFQDGAGDALTAIAVALGLDPNSTSLAMVLKAITDMKAGIAGGEGGKGMPEGMMAEHSKMRTDFAALQETLKAQATTIATFEHERRVGKYVHMAEGWGAIPGKPEELGTQLAETEEKAGDKVAAMVVAQFAAANEAAQQAGVLSRRGTARTGGSGDSEADKFLKNAEATGLNHAKAVVKLSKERPDLFRQYQVANLAGGNGNGE